MSLTCPRSNELHPERFDKSRMKGLFHLRKRDVASELPVDARDPASPSAAGDDLGLNSRIVRDQDRAVLEKRRGEPALGAARDLPAANHNLIPRGG